MEAVVNELIVLFAANAGLAGLLASICIWSPRKALAKGVAIVVAACFMPGIYAGFLHLMSMPKPINLEWWHAHADEATILASTMREDEGIYLWLQLDEAREPRSYVLPWSRDLAEQLQAAGREAERRESDLRMRLPFERSLDPEEPKFYATPQPAMPQKPPGNDDPLMYDPKLGQAT
jgi:hypothetical protein